MDIFLQNTTSNVIATVTYEISYVLYGLPCKEKSYQPEEGTGIEAKHVVESNNVRTFIKNKQISCV